MSKRVLVLGCLWSILVLVLQLRPVDDVDLFWQIRLGQLTLERGELILADPFTYTHGGDPQPAIYWLFQIGAALLFEMGSYEAVRLGHALCFAAAFLVAGLLPAAAIPARSASEVRTGSLASLSAAVVLGFLVGLSNSSVRPQGVALLGFAGLLWVFQQPWPLGRKLLILAPLLLIWQNCHPSVVIGFLAVGALTAGAWLRWLPDRKRPVPWPETAIVLLVGLSQFATPMGADVLEVSRTNLRVARDWLEVTEWLPPWDPAVRGAMVVFWIALGITLALAPLVWRQTSLAELLMAGLMTALALSAARFALFWGVALIPLWARWFEKLRPARFFNWTDGRVRRRVAAGWLGLCGAAAVAVPLFLNQHDHPGEIPLAEIRVLRAVMPVGRIYNYREWGGPLILEGSPGWRIALDGRLYLFPEAQEWEAYHAAALGQVPVSRLMESHQPDAFFLRRSFHAELIRLLRESPDWQEIPVTGEAAIFIRRAAAPGS